MDAVAAASAIVGLAFPVFKFAKELRDRIKLVAPEKAELLAALIEYEKDINLLESLYNDNKELLDPHELHTDLKELAGIIRDLDECLNSINPDLGKKKLPGLKELWKTGDLREKLTASNAKIGSVRARWQTRLQIHALLSSNVILEQNHSVQTEMTAQFQQILTMLQQGQVRQRSRTHSMHSQGESAGFNSQTTRVVVNTTTSTVTFSILSTDASLSYDRIKLRLEEYRTLLASDSDTIELSTENGKTVIYRKQAGEMEKYLDQAEILLRDVVQSRDISTVVILHRLRDLAEILDNLKLDDECRLTADCALDLAEALGRRSLEFRHEQAETLALIAGLSVYQPRARTLFIQAVSICEEVVANNASYSNKTSLLIVLVRAGYWALGHSDAFCTLWLGRAVQLMTKELPPAMVHPHFRSTIYYTYGNGLYKLKQYSDALEAYHEAISIHRTSENNAPAGNNHYIAQILMSMGITLHDLGKYDDAIVAYKEVLEICSTASTQDPLQYKELMARTLHHYGITLGTLNRTSEAAVVEKQAISLLLKLAQTGKEDTKSLSLALHNYGHSYGSLGQHEESSVASREPDQLLICGLGEVITFQTPKLNKQLCKFLLSSYIQAGDILRKSRRVKWFSLQAVHIARQAFHLIILFNNFVGPDGPTNKQYDEGKDLDDAFEELEDKIDALGNLELDEAYRFEEDHKYDLGRLYQIFFATRDFYPNGRDYKTDPVLKRLVDLDHANLTLARYPQVTDVHDENDGSNQAPISDVGVSQAEPNDTSAVPAFNNETAPHRTKIFQNTVRETYPDRNNMQKILSNVQLQLENGHPITADAVLQLLDRDPRTGMFTCSWHENHTPCDWPGSHLASQAEAHINSHLERRPYICNGRECGSNNWSAVFCFRVTVLGPSNLRIILFWFNSRAAFYSSEDLYAHQTRRNRVQCSRCGKNITAQNMNRHQSPAACFRLIVSELWMKLRNSL